MEGERTSSQASMGRGVTKPTYGCPDLSSMVGGGVFTDGAADETGIRTKVI